MLQRVFDLLSLQSRRSRELRERAYSLRYFMLPPVQVPLGHPSLPPGSHRNEESLELAKIYKERSVRLPHSLPLLLPSPHAGLDEDAQTRSATTTRMTPCRTLTPFPPPQPPQTYNYKGLLFRPLPPCRTRPPPSSYRIEELRQWDIVTLPAWQA